MSASLIHLLLLALPLGALLGFVGGLFGMGGGIVAIPVLVLGFGMDQANAQGTALVMMVPNLLLGWWRYVRYNPVDWRQALAIGAIGAFTTWATAHFAHHLDQGLLRVLFALFLFVLALSMVLGATPAVERPARAHPRWVPLVGVVGGSSMGLLGIGGGLVATPVLTRVFGLGQKVAQSFALALVAPASAFALLAYAQNDRVEWGMGGALALGGIATVALGVSVAHRWPERRLRKGFGLMMAVTAVWLIVSQWVLVLA